MDKVKIQKLIDLLREILDAQDELGNEGYATADRQVIKVYNDSAMLISRLEKLIAS